MIHPIGKDEVTGSNPVISSKKPVKMTGFSFAFIACFK